ncbi:unnamed protein product, partial [Amoebophrya sp. A25]|eukprot:GSA25T00009153001.1
MQKFAEHVKTRLGERLDYVTTITDPSNAIVAGKPSLVRSCDLRESGKAKWNLTRHRFSEGRLFGVPFDAGADRVDFFIALLRKDPLEGLSGAFVFPKQFLQDNGILSVNYKEGKCGMMLYPPGCRAVSLAKKEFALK